MAQSSQCYLPRFAPAVDGPKRPVSMKTRPTSSQCAQLLTAWHEGRLESILQATWALVLHYYIQTEDISFGYQHIDGASMSSRHPVQRSNVTTPDRDMSAIRLAIDENESIQAIVDKVRTGDGIKQLGGASEGHLPFNTILMLRTYRRTDDPSPSSKTLLASALPDQVFISPIRQSAHI